MAAARAGPEVRAPRGSRRWARSRRRGPDAGRRCSRARADRRGVGDWVDWVAKRAASRRTWRAPRRRLGRRPAEGLDLQYHDLRPDRSLADRVGSSASSRRRGRGGHDRATDHHAGLLPGRCLQKWPDDIVAANWDSMVFDVGRDPLRRVPMMEPLRGTAAHVGSLIDDSETAPSCSSARGTKEEERWPNSRSRRRPTPGPRRSSRTPRHLRAGREAQGRARRPARRDRRGPRDQRRGLREVLRQKGGQ